MLELRSPDGAFEQIEEFLRERGFFAPGGEDLVADLYLGYGLSDTIRRDGRDDPTRPPEPCPALPQAACSLERTPLVTDRHKRSRTASVSAVGFVAGQVPSRDEGL